MIIKHTKYILQNTNLTNWNENPPVWNREWFLLQVNQVIWIVKEAKASPIWGLAPMVVEDSKRAEDKSKGLFVRGLNQFHISTAKGHCKNKWSALSIPQW